MQTLNNLRRIFAPTKEDLIYIENYQIVYKGVLLEAIKRKIDRHVMEWTDRTMAMARLINKEIGNASENEENLELRIGNKLILNPTEITDKLKKHFL